jgi:hypothetical protein
MTEEKHALINHKIIDESHTKRSEFFEAQQILPNS